MSDKPRKFKGGVHPNDSKALSASKPIQDAPLLDTYKVIMHQNIGAPPELVVFQCGADSLAGDPITHLKFSEAAHAHGAARLAARAIDWGDIPILAVGGGGYNRRNLARAWTRVVEALAELPR